MTIQENNRGNRNLTLETIEQRKVLAAAGLSAALIVDSVDEGLADSTAEVAASQNDGEPLKFASTSLSNDGQFSGDATIEDGPVDSVAQNLNASEPANVYADSYTDAVDDIHSRDGGMLHDMAEALSPIETVEEFTERAMQPIGDGGDPPKDDDDQSDNPVDEQDSEDELDEGDKPSDGN